MNKFNEFKKARELNEDGFSLIELVVAVGILAILSVVGVIAYSGITDNARTQAVNAAAAEVYTAAVAYDSDGDTTTNPLTVGTDWSATTDGNITVDVDRNSADQIVVRAQMEDHPDKTAYKGAGAEGHTWA